MALAQEKNPSYTYGDMLNWDTDVRYELYDGSPVALASPSDVHQEIVGELFGQLREYLKDKPCKPYFAPFDVRLFERKGDAPDDVDTVVQPDLMVVCDKSKVDRRGVHGAPDLIIEVLSPSSERYDRFNKLNLYQKAGVREYWIVNPESRSVQTFVLEDGHYTFPAYVEGGGELAVTIFPDCVIDLSAVFPSQEETEEANA